MSLPLNPVLNCNILFVNYDILRIYQFLTNKNDSILYENIRQDIINLHKWTQLLRNINHKYLYSISHIEHFNSLDNYLVDDTKFVYNFNLTQPKLWSRVLVPEIEIINYNEYKDMIENSSNILISAQLPFLYEEESKWYIDPVLFELIDRLR
jgi:hypothetical protein